MAELAAHGPYDYGGRTWRLARRDDGTLTLQIADADDWREVYPNYGALLELARLAAERDRLRAALRNLLATKPGKHGSGHDRNCAFCQEQEEAADKARAALGADQ